MLDNQNQNTKVYPLVTIICICFNQAAYVRQALESVAGQTYPAIELLIIDNASTDNSRQQIQSFVQKYPDARFIQNQENVGLNRAFNQGLRLTGGQYVVDLSADDVLLPDRIARQVTQFEQLPDNYGIVFSNAKFIDADGRQMGYHFAVDAHEKSRVRVPSGEIFADVLRSYFICTPTMLMRRSMLDELGGYDESLAYEDFDLWVRSARSYCYAYLDEVLTLKRIRPDSLSAQVLRPDNRLLTSTFVICRKAFDRCQNPDEFQALAERIRTFIRKAFYAEQFNLAGQFGQLLRQIEPPDLLTRSVLLLCRLRLRVNRVYQLYHQLRFRR